MKKKLVSLLSMLACMAMFTSCDAGSIVTELVDDVYGLIGDINGYITGEYSSESSSESNSTTPDDPGTTNPDDPGTTNPDDPGTTNPDGPGTTKPHEHDYVKHDAVDATCEEDGNEAYYTCNGCDLIFDEDKATLEAIPTIAATHNYVFVEGKDATCSEKGVLDHYTCGECDKLFDLTKNEIINVEVEIDATNHSATTLIIAQTQPTKLNYKAGEAFDPTGMVVVYKCNDCEGEIVDNQFLTYTYATENATAFAIGDTKVTVNYQGFSFDVAITVAKEAVEIFGVEETYETVCSVAPSIQASSNLADSNIVITYYDGETEVEPSTFVAGKTYTAKVTIAETETALGAEATATVTVNHGYAWKEDADDWKKMTYECVCGEKKAFYAMNYQSPYVDADNLAIDLSAFIHDAENVSISSVKQIIRMKDGAYLAAKDGEVVDIEFTNEGMTYSFAADKYEKPSGEWKPYILTLAVDYVIDGVECSLVVEAKLVDKLIQTAADLETLVYMGADTVENGGTQNTGYYVLANDIDASEWTLPASKHAWQENIGFCGVLEGNNYTINNLNVAAWTNGLFGALGAGSKIQNISFKNVVMGDSAYFFALVIRKTQLSNVNIEFSANTASSLFADTADGCTFDNVNVKTIVGAPLFWNIDNSPMEALPAGINVSNYAQYTVTFDSNGGNAVEPATVNEGGTVAQPATPEKVDEEYEYEFLGWYLDDQAWDFSTAITEDITLTAKWNQVEKAPEDVLLYAKTQTLSKWDYGTEITVGKATDETYGDVFTITFGASGEQSIQHPAIDTTGYEKVYFNVYNPCASVVTLNIHGGYGAWGEATIALAANNWTLVELNVSAFTKDVAGKIFFILSIPEDSLEGWKITSFYGVKAEETPDEPVSNKVEVSLSLGQMTDTGTTNEYGKVYNVKQGQWFINNNNKDTMVDFQKGALAAALPAGYDYFEFYMYNPTDTAYTFHLAGSVSSGWKDSTDFIALPAKAWTKIIISAADIQWNTEGAWYVYIQGGNGDGATQEGWQVSTVYAVKIEKQEISLNLGQMTDTGTANEYGKVYNLKQGQWFIDNNNKDTMVDFQKGALAAALPAGYDHFEFYIYNPTDTAYTFHLAGSVSSGWKDSADFIALPAKAWTKIIISAADIQWNTEGAWYVYIQGGNGDGATQEGWQVTTVYAVK